MNDNLIKSAVSDIIGSTFMSLFSELITEKKQEQFKQHHILSHLIRKMPLNQDNRLAVGWIAHYLTGVSFNVANQTIINKLRTSPTFFNGLLLGALNGSAGIAIWKAAYEPHPSSPNIRLNKYLAHLVLAHLIFASLANVSMKGISNNQEKESATNLSAF
jgi:hypothetical protein